MRNTPRGTRHGVVAGLMIGGVLLSGGMFRGTADAPGGVAAMDRINPAFRTDPAGTDKKLRVLFLSCGTEDPRLAGMKQAADELTARKIKVVFKAYPGELEW